MAAACCSATRSPTGSPRCATCRRESTSAAPRVIPTGRARTISRSRSSSCARSPTGRSRSSSRSAPPAPTTTSQLAVKAGADVIVVDGMQGGTAATQDVFIEHVGIPTLAAMRLAVDALQELGMHRKVQLIVSGGIRSGRRRGEGARARRRRGLDRYRRADRDGRQQPRAGRAVPSRSAARPATTTTGRRAATRPASRRRTKSSPRASTRSSAAQKLANYLRVLTLETQTLARACGKSHVHNLEAEDLVALTVEAAAMARVPLAGTSWIPGRLRSRAVRRPKAVSAPGRSPGTPRGAARGSTAAARPGRRHCSASRRARSVQRGDAGGCPRTPQTPRVIRRRSRCRARRPPRRRRAGRACSRW